MTYLEYSERLSYILDLVTKGKLLCPSDLAENFKCSERTVRRMINTLRAKGHPIVYSKAMGRYAIIEDGQKLSV